MSSNLISPVLCLAAFTFTSARAETVDEVLARLDRSAQDFKSFSAKMTRVTYTKVYDETTESNGVVRVTRRKDGLAGVMEFSGPDARVEAFDGRTGQRYLPKANVVEIYDLGKLAASVEQVILLGFGTRRAELAKNYDIKMGGPDTVGQQPATRIELTPKSKDVKDRATRIDLWIPDGKGYPIQEKILEPSKNYDLVTYSDVTMPAPPNSSFEITLPPGVKKNYPQR
jgi:outer membrane lipoprotein-sorting protein